MVAYRSASAGGDALALELAALDLAEAAATTRLQRWWCCPEPSPRPFHHERRPNNSWIQAISTIMTSHRYLSTMAPVCVVAVNLYLKSESLFNFILKSLPAGLPHRIQNIRRCMPRQWQRRSKIEKRRGASMFKHQEKLQTQTTQSEACFMLQQ